ncbi:MAG: PQQ-binding-like beta-propeller repeat protein, partial [Alphaproteobacteria bacterium]
AACGGGPEEEILPGTRISVMDFDRALQPNASISDVRVSLPRPAVNEAWPGTNGFPSHVQGHLALGDSLRPAWRTSVGSGAGSRENLVSPPTVAQGLAFAMDADGRVSAVDLESGQQRWRRDLAPDHEREGLWGGGIAWQDGRLYVATGFAQVIALDAVTGSELWRRRLSGPMRSGPTVVGNRLFVLTIDNRLTALATDDGSELWTHAAIEETAAILGGASPAVASGVVVAAFSSGEIFALREENGRPLWSDTLAALRRIDAVSSLADIRGAPVIAGDQVIAASHSGRMVAIDLPTGRRIWELPAGGINMPWVAGDYVFTVTSDGQVLAIQRQTGQVRWTTALARFTDADEDQRIAWYGPVLAGDRLILAGSHGVALALSPYTGALLGSLDLGGPLSVPPVVARGQVLFLTNAAQLLAYR